MQDSYEALFSVTKNGKDGYINAKGQVVIDCEFDYASSFAEGLGRVWVKEKIGFIDTKGNFVIPPQFKSASQFSEGLSCVSFDDENYGFINRTGQIVIPLSYYHCYDFLNGYAHVQKDIFSGGSFIDKTGKTKLEGRDLLVSEYSEGLINCKDDKDNWGFIDMEENIIIEAVYEFAMPFHDGRAAVIPKKLKSGKNNQKRKYGFIDKNGEMIIDRLFEGADVRFSEGLCAVWNRWCGYINENGETIIPFQFEMGEHFSEGRAVFKPRGRIEKYGYINKQGDIVCKPIFISAEPFENGLALVVTGGRKLGKELHGYINKQGDYVWEPQR